MSGRWVPPLKGSLRMTTSPGSSVPDFRQGRFHAHGHGAQMDGHVVSQGHGNSLGIKEGAGVVPSSL